MQYAYGEMVLYVYTCIIGGRKLSLARLKLLLKWLPPFVLPPTEQVYHVSVPTQPSAQVGEGIVKLSSPNTVSVISPTTGKPIMEVPFRDIRRLGCCAFFNFSLVWFETCRSCKSNQPDLFYFFVVPSGIDNARIITREIKGAIERYTGVFLIMESDQTELAFISRNHYGCSSYPVMARNNIICRALGGQYAVPYSRQTVPPTIRRESDPAMPIGVSLEEYAATKPSRRTFSVSSGITQKPRTIMRGHTTLDRLRNVSCSSAGSQNSLELDRTDTSPPLSEVFDSSFSPKRKLSQKDSLSSHSSTNSGPFSPAIAEEDEEVVREVVREEVDEDMGRTNMRSMHRLTRSGTDLQTIGRPNVPPRSRASLLPNLKKRSKTVHGI